MAELIPPLNRQTLSKMTAGEKRVARRLEKLLEDDYLIWYDIPIGKMRRYPDFIILHPSRGLLFLEVKDWKPSTLKKVSKTEVQLLTHQGLISKTHPLEQARDCTYQVVNMLSKDKKLCQQEGKHKGGLIMPYGWGVVFTNITRQQIEKAIPEDKREYLLPDHLMMYQDEIREDTNAEAFQEHLWGMFHYQFGQTLTLPQIDRVRWHLFPEVRIDDGGQINLFSSSTPVEQSLPDIVKIMDVQQEQLARSLGDGHRVIHGVAGSGKTLILGYRCLHLAHQLEKPILVLCYNITLAAKLRSFISSKGISGQVQVYHFHDWCGQQLKTYHIPILKSEAPSYQRTVESVIQAVEQGHIPRAQYGAVMIDEGHDFEANWLKLVTQMVDPESDSLLMLYDDAQSIYKKNRGLDFTLSSVGIKAKGRTTILRLNYRNTREILDFAYRFSSQYIDPKKADDDHIPLIEPEAAGASGIKPVVRQFPCLQDEISYSLKCLQKWHQDGVPWHDMAIIYINNKQGRMIKEKMKVVRIPHLILNSAKMKKQYDRTIDQVTALTIHSSKGLEFPRVIMLGIGELTDTTDNEKVQDDASLLYVGMTRAQECLLVTTSTNNLMSKCLLDIADESL